jgi:hypothetical protein
MSKIRLPFRGGSVKTVDGMKATPGHRIPRRFFRGKEFQKLTEEQQPTPPQGTPQFCPVCHRRFYAEAARSVCSIDCMRRRDA